MAARESNGTPHNLHPSLQDHRQQDQARGHRHWSSPREDGVQSRTHAGEESCLNGWTVDSWQHCIPQPSAEAPEDCSVSASNERARKSFCRCHRVALSRIFAMCSHVNYVREDAVCIRVFCELSAHKLFSLVGNDQHGRTKILDPSFRNALRHRPGSLVQDRNAQLVQRARTHRVAENDFGTVRRLHLKKKPTPCVSLKRKVRGSAAGNPCFGGCPLAAHAGHSNSRRT